MNDKKLGWIDRRKCTNIILLRIIPSKSRQISYCQLSPIFQNVTHWKILGKVIPLKPKVKFAFKWKIYQLFRIYKPGSFILFLKKIHTDFTLHMCNMCICGRVPLCSHAVTKAYRKILASFNILNSLCGMSICIKRSWCVNKGQRNAF